MRTKKPVVILWVIASFFCATSCDDAGDRIEYRGRILTTDTGGESIIVGAFTPAEDIHPIPVSGARVTIKSVHGEGWSLETQSDADGYFVLSVPRAHKEIEMAIEHKGYYPAKRQFTNGPRSRYKESTTILGKRKTT